METELTPAASNIGLMYLQFVNRRGISLVFAIVICILALRDRNGAAGWKLAFFAGLLLLPALFRLFY